MSKALVTSLVYILAFWRCARSMSSSAPSNCRDSLPSECPLLVEKHGCNHTIPDDPSHLYPGNVSWLCRASCQACLDPDSKHAGNQTAALCALYASTNGRYWTHNDAWCSATVDRCNWYGVVCDPRGDVISMFLVRNNMSGTLPEQLWELKELSRISMKDNHLHGTIPYTLGSLSMLTLAAFRGNLLEGTLPAFSNLKSLSLLDFSNCRISGTIPIEVTSLIGLKYLFLTHNLALSGSLPTQFGTLSKLVKIRASSLSLSGTIPQQLSLMTALTQIKWDSNSLSGTIPLNLYRLSALTQFRSQCNYQISGILPGQLGKLTHLENLSFNSNMISGTIPYGLWRTSLLKYMLLYENRISGTLSDKVFSHLQQLNWLGLNHNPSLSGSLPPQVFVSDGLFYLSIHNTPWLSGTFPQVAGSSGQFQEILLYNTSLSGCIPVSSPLESAKVVAIDSNRLSGVLPTELMNSPLLTDLVLFENTISGSISARIHDLTMLTNLQMNDNCLSGTFPAELTMLTALAKLQLGNLHLSGTIPPSFAPLASINLFVINKNPISGSLPSLPESLRVLIAHDCHFQGSMPSLKSNTNLKVLTLYQNTLQGHLTLPEGANLNQLFLQRNRLSCQIEATNITVKSNLVLAGNAFSAVDLPEWLVASDVSFLVVQNTWDQWKVTILEAAIGIVVTAGVVLYLTNGKMLSFVWFVPSSIVVKMQVTCIKLLFIWSIGVLVILCPLYYAGADYVECGKPWLRTTLAYFGGSHGSEWACAILAVITLVLLVTSVEGFTVLANRMYLSSNVSHKSAQAAKLKFRSKCCLAVSWFFVTCGLSIPSLAYVASTSLPENNSLGLSGVTLHFSQESVGIILWAISTLALPALSRFACALVGLNFDDGTYLSGTLIMTSRLFITILAPFCAALAMNEDCYARWMGLWEPCLSGSFDLDYDIPLGYSKGGSFYQTGTQTLHVSNNSDICQPSYVPDGRCPRSIISVLGSLLIAKLSALAFMSPVVHILLDTPQAINALRKLLCKPPDFDFPVTDVHIATVVMLLEIPLVLGFCVPIVVPLSLLALAGNTCALQFSRAARMQQQVRFATFYIWLSLVLGASLQMWLFYETQMQGLWLVVVGLPCVGLATLLTLRKTEVLSMPSLAARSDVVLALSTPLIKTSLEGETQGSSSDESPSHSEYKPPVLH